MKGICTIRKYFLEGDFVGSTVSAIKEKPSQFSLEVIEDSILISFDYRKYRALIDEHTDLKNFYIAYLEKNWVLDKEKRELEIVLNDADKRYLDFIEMHPQIENRIPLHYIASHLGITATQLSRIRKKLKNNAENQHM
jgi:CRP-like cAMP-binding protein